MVITTPELAPGFQLAGVETFSVDTIKQAEETLRRLLDSNEASLIVVRRQLLQGMDPGLQRQVEQSYQPVVMPIAGKLPEIPGEEHQRHITELIRQTIGFHITFGGEESKKQE